MLLIFTKNKTDEWLKLIKNKTNKRNEVNFSLFGYRLHINIKHRILSKYSFNGCNFFKDVFLFQLKIHLLC